MHELLYTWPNATKLYLIKLSALCANMIVVFLLMSFRVLAVINTCIIKLNNDIRYRDCVCQNVMLVFILSFRKGRVKYCRIGYMTK